MPAVSFSPLTSNVDICQHSHFRQIHVFLHRQKWAEGGRRHVWRHELTGSLEMVRQSSTSQQTPRWFWVWVLFTSLFSYRLREDETLNPFETLKRSLNTLNFLGVYLKDWTSQKSLHHQWGCSGSWSSVIKVFLSLWKKSTSVKIQILRIKRHLVLFFPAPGILVWFNTICNVPYVLQPIPAPSGHACVEVQGYWVPRGEAEPALDPSYVLTSSVKLNLRDLARVVSAG